MRNRNVLLLTLLGVAVLIIIIYGFNTSQDPQAYAETISEERKKSERFLLYNEDSPLDEEDKKNFKGLNYYEPDLTYKVRAKVTPIGGNQEITLPTSDGAEQTYRKFGYARFEIDGKPQQLLLLEVQDDPDELFLAFADATSARETYGGGRYLDLTRPAGESVTLDFNLAYNPYCAYVEGYSCPFPPPENTLNIPIRAGEKDY
ncbi:DUF1684 domain-containing protein [Roseivirga sp. BDSF3-8]|uniref:DUF1684 domain-containing protein n=1 Tax=Roseivirga sp. BDSF3-8 TaxID=3241598 RepID=UPI003531E7FB